MVRGHSREARFLIRLTRLSLGICCRMASMPKTKRKRNPKTFLRLSIWNNPDQQSSTA